MIRPLEVVPLSLDRSVGGAALLGAADGLAGRAGVALPGGIDAVFALDEPFRLLHLVEHSDADPSLGSARDDALTLLLGAGWSAAPDGPFTMPASLVPRWAALATAAACLERARRDDGEAAARWRAEAHAASEALPDEVRPLELGPRVASGPAAAPGGGGRAWSVLRHLVDLGADVAALAPVYGRGDVDTAETWFPLVSRAPGVARLITTTCYDAAEFLLEATIEVRPGWDAESEIYAVAHLRGQLRGVGRFTALPANRARALITLRPHAPDELWVSVVAEVGRAVPAYDPTLARAMWLGDLAGAAERAGQDEQAVDLWQGCSARYARSGAMTRATRAAQNAVDVLVRTGRLRVAERLARRFAAAGLAVVVDPAKARPAPQPFDAEGLGPI